MIRVGHLRLQQRAGMARRGPMQIKNHIQAGGIGFLHHRLYRVLIVVAGIGMVKDAVGVGANQAQPGIFIERNAHDVRLPTSDGAPIRIVALPKLTTGRIFRIPSLDGRAFKCAEVHTAQLHRGFRGIHEFIARDSDGKLGRIHHDHGGALARPAGTLTRQGICGGACR